MIGSFKSGLNQAAKSRKVNTEKLASKATRGVFNYMTLYV